MISFAELEPDEKLLDPETSPPGVTTIDRRPAAAKGSGALRALLVGLDLAGVMVAWVVAVLVFDRRAQQSPGKWLITSAGLSILTLAFLASQHLYRGRVCAIRSVELAAVARSLILTALLAGWLNRTMNVGSGLTADVVGASLCFFALACTRSGYSAWLRKSRSRGKFTRRVCVLGTNDEAEQLVRFLQEKPEFGYQVVGVLGDPKSWSGGDTDIPVSKLGSDVAGAVERAGASGVFVVATAVGPTHLERLLRQFGERGLHVQIYTGLSRLGWERVHASPMSHRLLFYVEGSRPTLWYLVLKRVVDLVLASTIFLAALPLLAIAAVTIKLEDGGPILYRQDRVGRDGQLFRLIKLRTMSPNAAEQLADLLEFNERDGPLFKLSYDPRVTRVGRFLRATSIDELPQLLNVLRGEMSIVGPRPALPSEVRQFDSDLTQRHTVLPGITGLWQVEARDNPSFEDYRRLDLFYVDNPSLFLDVAILASTVRVVLGRAQRALRTGGEVVIGEGGRSLEPVSELVSPLTAAPRTDPGVLGP